MKEKQDALPKPSPAEIEKLKAIKKKLVDKQTIVKK
jgi:hypothetical protein